MSRPDYMNRCLRCRATGAVSVVDTQSWNILGQTTVRLRHGDGSISPRMLLQQVEDAYEWVDGLIAMPAPIVDLGENVVMFRTKLPTRVIPITSGPAGAA